MKAVAQPVRLLPASALRVLHALLTVDHGGSRRRPATGSLGALFKHVRGTVEAMPAERGHPERIAATAAAVCFGLLHPPCFPTGNSALALAATDGTLRLNGFALEVDELEALEVVRACAEGAVSERALARWILASARQE